MKPASSDPIRTHQSLSRHRKHAPRVSRSPLNTQWKQSRNKGSSLCKFKLAVMRHPLRKSHPYEITLLSHREPYLHESTPLGPLLHSPASGLISALEPLMKTYGGLWIAHGQGSADRHFVDENSELDAPPYPAAPKYRLKRVWLSPEQERTFYWGFSNQTLWPLCHTAFERPNFNPLDWEGYRTVNQLFTDAIPLESLNSHSTLLVQDYHFALVPLLLRSRLLKLGIPRIEHPRISLFWHIPWPHSDLFQRCPWAREIVRGMNAADLIGFHTSASCKNFKDTAYEILGSESEQGAKVAPFPMGIETPPTPHISLTERHQLRQHYGVQTQYLAVGVDRIDYTKGIFERFQAVDRFLEVNPKYRGNFTLLQIGAPSRGEIPRYQTLLQDLQTEARRINAKHANQSNEVILFRAQHHARSELEKIYAIADLCLVTSLHDGMNLVAKEYLWNQPKPLHSCPAGALVLSKYAGAAEELTEAWQINPHDIEEIASTIKDILHTPEHERARRLRRLQQQVLDHNADHWANSFLRASRSNNENSARASTQKSIAG